MKALKWALLGLGAAVLIAVAVVAYFVATFDPNDYKPRIVELVKRQTGRTLALDGKIGLTFFPKIGATLGKVTLSEPNSPAIFARVDEARVAVALLPLLSRHVIVDRVTLTGLAVDLVRHKDGRTNFDDLTGRAANAGPPGEAPGPTATGLADRGRRRRHRDRQRHHRLARRDRRHQCAAVERHPQDRASRERRARQARRWRRASRATQPRANLQLDMEAGYRLDLQTQAVALSSLVAKVTGDAQGMSGIDACVKSETIDVDPSGPARHALRRGADREDEGWPRREGCHPAPRPRAGSSGKPADLG